MGRDGTGRALAVDGGGKGGEGGREGVVCIWSEEVVGCIYQAFLRWVLCSVLL